MRTLCALLIATALATLAVSGCTPCGEQPACRYADLLAACVSDAGGGCALSGTTSVLPGGGVLDASAVQTQASGVELTGVKLDMNSSISVPVAASAAIRAKLPLLDIVIPIYGQANQVSVLVDGQPWESCVPQMLGDLGEGATSTEEWKCPCPAGANSVELRTLDAVVAWATIQLTEATCTGEQDVVCGS